MRFKYIRSLEALFESTPQAVLQLVFIMRIEKYGDDNIDVQFPVLIISIVQSIISMTNSMLNADNMYMARKKFAKYKKRFPPSRHFLKHALLRLCEITYRIGLFALFWTVVGGMQFCFLLLYELIW